MSHNLGIKHAKHVEVVFLTTKEKIPMPKYFAPVYATAPSFAKCNQIMTLRKECIGEYIRTCTDEEMAGIEEAILNGLGIDRTVTFVTNEERVDNADMIRLETEKNLYKMLYEQLLGKLAGA